MATSNKDTEHLDRRQHQASVLRPGKPVPLRVDAQAFRSRKRAYA